MRETMVKAVVTLVILSASAQTCWALDSYRFLHVTIETPWMIFIFLLFAILAPFILMAVLVWRYSEKKTDVESDRAGSSEENYN